MSTWNARRGGRAQWIVGTLTGVLAVGACVAEDHGPALPNGPVDEEKPQIDERLAPPSNAPQEVLDAWRAVQAKERVPAATGAPSIEEPLSEGEATQRALAQGGLFYSRDGASELYSINTTTGAATLLGVTGVTSSTVGLAWDPTRDLFYGTAWATLLEINPDGSGFVNLGGAGQEGLAYDWVNSVLYAAINGAFRTVDTATGANGTTLAAPGIDMEGLAPNIGAGIIYGIGNSNNLMAYDIATDSWSTIGDTGVNWYESGLAYDEHNDVLYAGGGTASLYSIDPATAAATVIGDSGLSSLNGGMTYVAVPNDTRLNEIRIDQLSSDIDEHVELTGAAGSVLTGLYIIVIGDGAGGSGVVEAVVDLASQVMPNDGFLSIAEASFTLGAADFTTNLNFENGDNVTYMLVQDFTGSAGDDLDTNDDCQLDSTPWSQIIDAVALVDDPNGGECIYSATTVGPDGANPPPHTYRCPDTTGVWVIGQYDPADGGDTPGAANAPCGLPGDSCSQDDECVSLHCVDGVCCDTACDQDCEACNLSGSEGTCTAEASGAACGDITVTLCNAADTCDGAGTCLDNLAASGAACGDTGVDCLVDDTCDGAGACTDNGFEAADTACGDATDDECTNPDACDGSGTCDDNHEASGIACGDTGVECLVDDTCDGVGVCTDNGFEAADTACGDATDDECTDPDTCDGSGTCDDNHEASDFACGDQGVECVVDDACDGAGVCTDNGFDPAGTLCTDGTCDGTGTCEPGGTGGGGTGAGGTGAGGTGTGGTGTGGTGTGGTGTGGTSTGGSIPGDPGGDTEDDGGCGCRVVGERPLDNSSHGWLALLGLGLIAARRRES